MLDYVRCGADGAVTRSGLTGITKQRISGIPMALDTKDIERIAWLARLEITPEDVPGYATSLSSILVLVEQMQEVNTAHTEPLAHPLDLDARGREDIVTETNQREHFQQYAPAITSGYYLVPRVIE
jgi:aspartyl-tRNA(Asn)/glutamyl-tRNA(Gln) amidotransferase subunit C